MNWQTIVKENNLDVSIVRLNELAGRFDAEYYSNRFLDNNTKVISKEHFFLYDEKYIKRITDGDHGNPFYADEGVPYLKLEQIDNVGLDLSNPIFVSNDYAQKQSKKNYVSKGDVLISMKGTLGKIGIVINNDKAILNRDIAVVRTTENLFPEFLFLYLRSHSGQLIVEQFGSGGLQKGLYLGLIKLIVVPVASVAFQKELSIFVHKVYKLQEEAKQHYKEAEQMLLKEINLEEYKATDDAISVRNFSEVLAHNRFDAEYWQPKYEEITKRVSKVPQEKLGDIVLTKKGVEVGSEAYAKDGRDFIRVSDFTIYGIENGEKKIPEELYEKLKENFRPKKGEVLFTKDGTIGISFALNEDVDAIVSGAFLRLKPKVKIDNNYLALVLNSFYCKAQIERMSGGAIIAHLKPESAMQVKIPMLSEQKQEELAGKVLEALRLRKEAKELLEKAKRAVEIFVEKDESIALQYLEAEKGTRE